MKTWNLFLFCLFMLFLLSCRFGEDDPSEFYIKGSITDPDGNAITGAEVYFVFDDLGGGSYAPKDPTTVSEMRYRFTGTQMVFQWTTTFELNLTEFNILQGDPANHQVINANPIVPTNNPSGSSYSYTHPVVVQDEFWLEAKDTYGMEQHLGPFIQYTPIELSSFTAIEDENMHVLLTWETLSESNTLGFYVLRSESDQLVNAYSCSPLIQATNTNTSQTYAFADTEVVPEHTYFYWLQGVYMDGGTEHWGPISVTVFPPPELLSFTAEVTQTHTVALTWTTQYETGMYGWNLYRHDTNVLENAIKINPTLISAFNQNTPHTYSFTDTEVQADHNYYYWLEGVYMGGNSEFHGPLYVHIEAVEPPPLPTVLAFSNPYPNPAVNAISFQIAIPDSINAVVQIRRAGLYEILKEVSLTPGNHTLFWDCKDTQGNKVSNGCYLATCTATHTLSSSQQTQIIRHFIINDPSLGNAPAGYSYANGYKIPFWTSFLWDNEYNLTNEQGEETGTGTLPKGVTVWVKKEGYVTASQHILLDMTRDNVLNFVLQPLGRLIAKK